jgi:hypothetical protein
MWVSGTTGTSNVYTLSVGGQTVGTTTTSSTGPVSIPWNTTRFTDGPQVLTASVRDAGGRTGTTSATITLSNGVTAAPLTAGFTNPAAGATVSGTVAVGLTASGGSGSGYSYRLSLDGAQVATAASYTWNTSTASNGSHTLVVTVTDSAGQTATSSRTVTVSNSVSAPAPTGSLKVFITQPTTGATVGGTAWVVLWVEGTSGSSNVFTLSVDGTRIGSQTSSVRGPITIPWTTSSSGNGSHTLSGTVRDAAGNTGTTSMAITVRN